jgi:hypothetical protein
VQPQLDAAPWDELKEMCELYGRTKG